MNDPTQQAAEVAKQIADAHYSVPSKIFEATKQNLRLDATDILAPVLAGKDAEIERLDNLRISAENFASDFRKERDSLRAANAALAAEVAEAKRSEQVAHDIKSAEKKILLAEIEKNTQLRADKAAADDLLREADTAMNNLRENLPGTYNGYLRDTHERIRSCLTLPPAQQKETI